MKWPFVSRRKYDELLELLDRAAERLDEVQAQQVKLGLKLMTRDKRDQMAERFAVEWLRSSLIKKEDVHFVKIAKYSRMLADAMLEEMKQAPRPLDCQKPTPKTDENDDK